MSFEMLVKERRDENGLVGVYDLEAKEWRKVYAVDAREMIAGGTAAWDDPAGTEPPKDTSGQKISGDVDFNAYKDDQLRMFIGKAGLDLPASATRVQMIEALDEAGFKPPAEQQKSDPKTGQKSDQKNKK